ncbi:MAG: hypothetical protein AAB393_07690, partial [Bacteroidota bacterium]
GPASHTRTEVGTSTDGKNKATIILKGTINFVPLEGGCWKMDRISARFFVTARSQRSRCAGWETSAQSSNYMSELS